ncbi:MAG TPA: hypothetical protein VGL93_14515 [Streptosporangiaceae bacterium]
MGRRKKLFQQRRREERRFRVRGERRDPPDLRKLGKALISLAQAEAEKEAQAEHEDQQQPGGTRPDDAPDGGGGHA